MKDFNWALKILKKEKPLDLVKINETFPNTILNGIDIETAVFSLKQTGIWICPIILPSEWLNNVKTNLNNFNVKGINNLNDIQKLGNLNPSSTTYWHKESDLLKVPELNELIKDSVLIKIAAKYFDVMPVFDFATAWWSFPSDYSDSKSAQMFHFDMDRIKWLKVFIYLNDVTVDNGPHVFVKESHTHLSKKVKEDRRYSDDEANVLFPDNEFSILTAPAGTIFIEDTMGFHKGLKLKEGFRGIFEFEYSVGHFGYPHDKKELDAAFNW